MNRKISAIFLSTVLPTALLAGPNGLTPEILNRAKSVKGDSAAVQVSMPGASGILQATAANKTVSLAGSGAPRMPDKSASAESQSTNVQASLKASQSSGSAANETASLSSSRAPGNSSSAESQSANVQASLKASQSSGSSANETAPLGSSRAALAAGNSGAETQSPNVSSSLESSLSRGSNASRLGPERNFEKFQDSAQ